MLSLALSSLAYVPLAPLAPAAHRCSPVMETKADLESLASACNPIIGFWDPLNLADYTGMPAATSLLPYARAQNGSRDASYTSAVV